MPNFYFQQFAGRTSKRGQSWLEDVSAVPNATLKDFGLSLIKTGIVPNSGKEICCRGGVYISHRGSMSAVFSLNAAPQGYRDYHGRTDGVVINALFFKNEASYAGKSFKKAWEHPALQYPPQDTGTGPVFIHLDENKGTSEEEKAFFTLISEHWKEDVIVLFPNAGEAPRLIRLSVDIPNQNKQTEEKKQDDFSQTTHQFANNKSWGTFMKSQFMWGVIVGIALSVGAFLYFRPSEGTENVTKKINCLEFSLDKLEKGPQGYKLPLIINVVEGEKDSKKVIILLPTEELNSEQIKNKEEKRR